MVEKLTIFDFDDTLITSEANIKVIHSNGEEEILSSEEYAKYTPKPGDDFDYSEFDEYPQNAELISDTFSRFKAALNGSGDVVILTARSNTNPVEMFLRDQGVRGVEVVGVGSSNPMDKAKYVLDRIKTDDYKIVHVYEDNFKNIRAIKKVVDKEGVRFMSTKVNAGNLIENKAILRKLIREVFAELGNLGAQEVSKKDPGAGIVVVKKVDDVYKILGLRLFGRYDLPKGKIEEGETSMEAAIRETEEEASITDLQFNWGEVAYQTGPITIYLAETTQDGAIKRNPETGIFEHHGVKWLTFEEAECSLYSYLQGAATWARNIIFSD